MTGSGDLLADRRYGYAEAALREGDAAAAADLARQTLERAPGFAAAWFLLGRAYETLYDAEGRAPAALPLQGQAVGAFEAALAADPADRLGAGVRLAQLSVGDPMRAMSPGYVQALFDEYAVRFDRHLVQSLKYAGPALLHDAVRRAASRRLRPFRFATALDLGCGTGLAGAVFRSACGTLAGVDLSPAMVERARRKTLYDELAVGDLAVWLAARPERSADLALAADVFVYVADLAPVFAAVARALRPDGLFAFTTQAHDGGGVLLGADGRYAHAESHLRELSDGVGLQVALSEPASTRQDRGRDVPGLLTVLAR